MYCLAVLRYIHCLYVGNDQLALLLVAFIVRFDVVVYIDYKWIFGVCLRCIVVWIMDYNEISDNWFLFM